MKRTTLISSVPLLAVVLGVLLLTVHPALAAPSAADAIKAGDDCYNRGDFMGALWHFTAAKDLDPNQAGSWEKMAWAANAAGKRDDAWGFTVEAEKRGMDAPRLARVRAWIFLGKADDARAKGDLTNAKTWYQDAKNHASGGIDPEAGRRASEALAQLSSSSTTSSSTASSSASTASSTTSTSSSSSSGSTSSTSRSASATSTVAKDDTSSATASSTSSAADPSAPGPLTPPSKEEIESRIKAFASEKGFTTFTDAHGRLQVKDASGKPVPLGPEIFAPSGTMPSKEVIENRIQKWAAKMGLTTATDETSGRMIVKDANVVPLPPSIFYPVRSEDSASSDDAATASGTVASSTATVISATSSETISSPEDTLSGDD